MRFNVVGRKLGRPPIAVKCGSKLLLVAQGKAEPVMSLGAVRIQSDRVAKRSCCLRVMPISA